MPEVGGNLERERPETYETASPADGSPEERGDDRINWSLLAWKEATTGSGDSSRRLFH